MLAVTGGKGGTGKTTTTLGLARAFAAAGTAVVAVDADWDLPDLGALAGGPRRTEFTDGEAAASPLSVAFRLDDADGHRDAADVRVLPAPATPAERDPGRVLRAIRRDTPEGTVVLVDCPAGAGPDAVAPLGVADGAVLVTEPCAAAVRDAVKTAGMARALGTPVVAAAVTRATAVPPGVADALGCPVVASVPRGSAPPLDDERVRAAYAEAAAALAVEAPARVRGV
ncbi:MinD/ParA family ATP-binding protein [Halobaculum sp. EA56]|uniref:MinD/ParA family ATP-binding protein n=1 Tax=Halobaculum sp. EA56 TaxID=3421648 RepID=UPI003EB9D403